MESTENNKKMKIVRDVRRATTAGVSLPSYDRNALRKSWVHFGPSHFFCAHQAFYVHRLNELLHSLGMAGVGITAVSLHSRNVTDALNEQDGLFTLVEKGHKGEEFHVIGCISAALHAPSQPDAMWSVLTSCNTTIVSMTVTQKGYYAVEVNASQGKQTSIGRWTMDTAHKDVQNDIACPNSPVTAPGIVVEALFRRFSEGVQPFTVLSCDNMPENGDTLRDVVLELAKAQNRPASFQAWLKRRCAFPNSMVDRIAPQCTKDLIDLVKSKGIDDNRPVPTEAKWSKWVIQRKFCNVRPPLELVGVEFPVSTQSAELVKLRMLNGAHMAMGVVGTLAGMQYMHEAMSYPPLRTFLRAFHAEMASSLADHCPTTGARAMIATLHERLSNPAIKDTLIRLTRDVTKKLDARFLSAVRDIFQANDNDDAQQARHICFAIAAWMHFVGGESWEVVDPELKCLKSLAKEKNPHKFLRAEWFGDDMVENESFVQQVTSAYDLIEKHGARGALEVYANNYGSRGVKVANWPPVAHEKQGMVKPKTGSKDMLLDTTKEPRKAPIVLQPANKTWHATRTAGEVLGHGRTNVDVM